MKKTLLAAALVMVSGSALAVDGGHIVDWPPESPDNQYHLNK